MDQLKEQVYRVAASAGNDAVAAVARYEGSETNLWGFLTQEDQSQLWKEAKHLHTGEKDIDAKPSLESKELQELRAAVTKLALTYLTRTPKKELTGGPSKPAETPRAGGPIKESDFQKESEKK